jgi:ankyrin repeat protein
MIKPDEFESEAGQLTWDTIVAAAEGDVIALRRLIERNSRLALSEYWYTPAIHFAVREGHIEAVQLLLDAGAHPEFLIARGAPTNLPDDEPWATALAWAERRGHSQIASILRTRGVMR